MPNPMKCEGYGIGGLNFQKEKKKKEKKRLFLLFYLLEKNHSGS